MCSALHLCGLSYIEFRPSVRHCSGNSSLRMFCTNYSFYDSFFSKHKNRPSKCSADTLKIFKSRTMPKTLCGYSASCDGASLPSEGPAVKPAAPPTSYSQAHQSGLLKWGNQSPLLLFIMPSIQWVLGSTRHRVRRWRSKDSLQEVASSLHHLGPSNSSHHAWTLYPLNQPYSPKKRIISKSLLELTPFQENKNQVTDHMCYYTIPTFYEHMHHHKHTLIYSSSNSNELAVAH